MCQIGVRISSTSATRDLRHRDIPDAREGVNLQGAEPVPRVRRAPPPGPLLLDDALGGLGEGGDTHQTPLLGERIASRAGELAVGERLLAGLGERDQLDAAESELPLASPDDEALDPAAGSGLLDVEVESVPVAVSSGRSGAHEGGREPLVGMAAPGLGLTAFRVGSVHIIHPIIVAGMEPDYKGRRWTGKVGGTLHKTLRLKEVTNSYERYRTPSDSVRPTCAAIPPSKRLASPAPHRSRCSRGFVHGLLRNVAEREPVLP